MNSWSNSIRQWFGLSGACHDFSAADAADLAQPVLNYFDETFVIRITVDEIPDEMFAILDTGMAHTVIETTTCTGCGASGTSSTVDVSGPPGGLTVSSTAVTGKLNNPATDYAGFEGTTTFCIFKDSAYAGTAPTSGNIAAMPCIQSANVHFADSVTTPNPDATAYLGMALGNG